MNFSSKLISFITISSKYIHDSSVTIGSVVVLTRVPHWYYLGPYLFNIKDV